MSLSVDDGKLLEKYKAVCTKIEDLKSIYLNALPVYHDRSMQTKIRTYNDKVFTNLRGFHELEFDIKCYSFIATCIESLKTRYYLQLYLNNCAYKIANKEMTDYLDRNLSEG